MSQEDSECTGQTISPLPSSLYYISKAPYRFNRGAFSCHSSLSPHVSLSPHIFVMAEVLLHLLPKPMQSYARHASGGSILLDPPYILYQLALPR